LNEDSKTEHTYDRETTPTRVSTPQMKRSFSVGSIYRKKDVQPYIADRKKLEAVISVYE